VRIGGALRRGPVFASIDLPQLKVLNMTGRPIGAVLACGILICAAAAPSSLKASNLAHQFDLDLARLTGVWHELGRTPNRFEDNTPRMGDAHFSPCFNASSHYTLAARNRLRIENTCLRRSKRGTVIRDRMSAIAVAKKGAGGRNLKVTFGRRVSRAVQRIFTGGVGFRVHCLGPVNVEGLYEWMVIGSARKAAIFLLTRDRKVSGNTKDRILSCARSAKLPVHKLIFRQH